MVLSTDGGRVAFATWIDGKNVMVVDSNQGAPYDFVAFPPAMSEDGSVVAYAARLESMQYCVINERRGPCFKEVGPPVLSPDGTSVAHTAADDEGAFVVFNGIRGPRFQWVGEPVLRPDGNEVAYCAEDGSSFVVVGNHRGPSFEHVIRPLYASDGRTVAYAGRRKGRWSLMFGDREVPVEGEVVSIFTGSRIGYVVDQGSGFSVGVPGKKISREYDKIRWPRFSTNGDPVYFAQKGDQNYLVCGESEEVLGKGAIWDPQFGDGGHRVRFDMKIGRELWRKDVVFSDRGRAE